MNDLIPEAISASSDDELFKLLTKELEKRVSVTRGSPEFVTEIQNFLSD